MHYRIALVLFLGLGQGACIKSMAINSLGDALAKGGGTYARDNDPELVRDATAFGLKTMESLLDAEPEHKGLRLAAARGFTQYGYAFLQAEADYIEDDDYAQSKHLRKRAKGMYVRARQHGLLGLAVEVEDFEAKLKKNSAKALKEVEEEDVGLLFWTAQAWAAAVSLDKEDAELAAGLDLVGEMMARALALDANYGDGAIYDFLLAWDGGRPKAGGGSQERAREHMAKSLELSGGKRLAPLVSFAEIVAVKNQDQKEFDALLDRVLNFDVDSAPDLRLANLIVQKRARWLKAHRDDLFL